MSNFAEMKLPEQTFVPLGRLLVIKVYEQTQTAKGIMLPNGAMKEQPSQSVESIRALVVAAGSMCKYARRGDVLVLKGGAPCMPVKHMGNELLFCTDELSGPLGIESRLVDGQRVPAMDCSGDDAVRHKMDDLRNAVECLSGQVTADG